MFAGSSVNGIPILTNRKYTTRIAVHADEWAVIGGLMDETKNKSVSGVAGPARIPLLGRLFRTENQGKGPGPYRDPHQAARDGRAPGGHETAPMPVGTETRPLSPL